MRRFRSPPSDQFAFFTDNRLHSSGSIAGRWPFAEAAAGGSPAGGRFIHCP